VHLGLDEDTVRAIGSDINPGDSAIVAEIDEGSTEPIDSIVASHRGVLYRTDVWS
jgi:hypothetical protein